MNYLAKIMILVLPVISLVANADNMFSISKECSKILRIAKKYKIDSLEGYQCGKEIQNPKRFQLKGLKLLAAVEYDSYSSSAYYVGDNILDGVVSYPDGPNDNLAFETKNGYFNFGGGSDEKSLATIKYPLKYNLNGMVETPTCKSGELKADAKIKIKFVNDVKAESCQEGSWVYDYEVISVGKYSCRQ